MGIVFYPQLIMRMKMIMNIRPLRGSFLFLCYPDESLKIKTKPGFRPLWGAFLFLCGGIRRGSFQRHVSVPYGDLFYFYSCPMETSPDIEKTCTLRCKKISPVKSGDLKLFKCSVPRFYALRCKTTILLVLSSPSLDHKYDLTE